MVREATLKGSKMSPLGSSILALDEHVTRKIFSNSPVCDEREKKDGLCVPRLFFLNKKMMRILSCMLWDC